MDSYAGLNIRNVGVGGIKILWGVVTTWSGSKLIWFLGFLEILFVGVNTPISFLCMLDVQNRVWLRAYGTKPTNWGVGVATFILYEKIMLSRAS